MLFRNSVSRAFDLLVAFIMFAVAAISMPGAARAQSMPDQSKNRVVCETFGALKALIKGLPNSRSIENQASATNPAIQGCVWIIGRGYLPAADIGQPLGWAFLDPYTVAVHLLSYKGKAVLHASVIKPQQTTRMQDGCDFFRRTVTFSNGEKQALFGGTRAGMSPRCFELVDLVERASEINKPVVSYTQHWKSRPVWRGNNACTNTASLVEGLDKVINEQQINFSSYDVFRRDRGCIVRDVTEIAASRFLGLYLSHEYDQGLKLWFELHQVIYRTPSTGRLTYALMPTNPTRASMLKVGQQCISSVADLDGMKLYGSAIDDVPGTIMRVKASELQISNQSQVPVGRDDCHIGNTFSRSR